MRARVLENCIVPKVKMIWGKMKTALVSKVINELGK